MPSIFEFVNIVIGKRGLPTLDLVLEFLHEWSVQHNGDIDFLARNVRLITGWRENIDTYFSYLPESHYTIGYDDDKFAEWMQEDNPTGEERCIIINDAFGVYLSTSDRFIKFRDLLPTAKQKRIRIIIISQYVFPQIPYQLVQLIEVVVYFKYPRFQDFWTNIHARYLEPHVHGRQITLLQFETLISLFKSRIVFKLQNPQLAVLLD